MGAGAAVVAGDDRGEDAPPVAFAETWIRAWNDRDMQLVSRMTCHYLPVFMAPSDVQVHLDRLPAGGPVVAEYAVTGTGSGTAYGREGVVVHVAYTRGGEDTLRSERVFVRVRDDGEMCIGALTTW